MEYNGEQENSGVIERATVRSLCKKTQQNYIDRSARHVALRADIYFYVSVCEDLTFLETNSHLSCDSLSYDSSKASSKASSPHSAI
jgi:hypothetical protein